MWKKRRPSLALARPHVEKDESEVRWLISYSDFMMQLLCLFILLYSVASIDQGKVAKIASAYRAHVGLGDPSGQERPTDGVRPALGERPLVGGDLAGADVPPDPRFKVEEIPGGWRVGFTGELFDPGASELTVHGREALDAASIFLSAYAGQIVVTGVAGEGPEDAVAGDAPRLASQRALAAAAHLVRPGFPRALDPRFIRAVGGLAEKDGARRGRRISIVLKVD